MRKWIKSLKKIDCAAKIKISLRFVLFKIKTGEIRFFYARKNNTLFDKSCLLSTKAGLTTIQNKINKQDIKEICTQERQKNIIAIQIDRLCENGCHLTRKMFIGCPCSLIPEPSLRNHQISFLISYEDTKPPFKDNLCLF